MPHGRHHARSALFGSDATGQIDPVSFDFDSFAPFLKEVHPLDRQI